jgi:YggT family protein
MGRQKKSTGPSLRIGDDPYSRNKGGIMFVLGNIIIGISKVLDVVLNIYMWVIIIRALISWVNPDPYNPVVQFLQRVTEPVLRPLRKLVPSWKLGFDLSPLIAILIIMFLQVALVRTLYRVGQSLGQ